MAKTSSTRRKPTKSRKAAAKRPLPRLTLRGVLRWTGRGAVALVALFLLLVILGIFINPRLTPYLIAEGWRQGGVDRVWVPIEDMAPEMARAVVASEDANFCEHWGFDMKAIRAAMNEGAGRGASTISQQVTKNVFLWQGRSWPRKALEALMTPVVELFWPKRRILEVYLNVAETGKGIFGVEAAAQHYFGVSAAKLSPPQAALIAAALPDPKGRNPGHPSGYLRGRARAILDGAATIRADGRAACFED
ncbi:monofunctional biosynthetic peptidoglycan transglycosylase [Defluviimonas denitrificans]|jgi:monofunctional biosynthetic peptidoglycan transglycosylase|uniref:Biosynthetic peptidoglycan transglycosylase n=1 Tax=Albidovulum denitrificans TaxID=404881 RepID=A0A2S8S8S3_9RHOB|nr:monofunctional biosynthetic peptidoglycan transglycosylase [Defluviimonas denitrificans]PQV57183.1 monofunctional biosynthetic peptidoglycan transglycosylase [Defluviimonas denitrificans]